MNPHDGFRIVMYAMFLSLTMGVCDVNEDHLTTSLYSTSIKWL